MKMFEELTRDQLIEECEELGIGKVVGTSNPHKPTKTYLLSAIAKKLSYDKVPVEEVVAEVKEVIKDEIPNTRKPQSAAKLARLEMFRKDRVIIHDTQEGQTKDKDEIIPISWGNRYLGGQTDFVSLSGEPQYIRRGAINNLIDATTVQSVSKANGAGVRSQVSKRFVVTEVTGLTPKELEELAAKQRMRNSKYA